MWVFNQIIITPSTMALGFRRSLLIALALVAVVLVTVFMARAKRARVAKRVRLEIDARCKDTAADTVFVCLHGPVTEGTLTRVFENSACPFRVRVGMPGGGGGSRRQANAKVLDRYNKHAVRQVGRSFEDQVRIGGEYRGERWVLVLHGDATPVPNWDAVGIAQMRGLPPNSVVTAAPMSAAATGVNAGGSSSTFPAALALQEQQHGAHAQVQAVRVCKPPPPAPKPVALFWTPACAFSPAGAWRGMDPTDPSTGPRLWTRGIDFYTSPVPIAHTPYPQPWPVSVDGVADAARSVAEYAAFCGIDFGPPAVRVSARAVMGVTPGAKPDELIIKHCSLEAFEEKRSALTKI